MKPKISVGIHAKYAGITHNGARADWTLTISVEQSAIAAEGSAPIDRDGLWQAVSDLNTALHEAFGEPLSARQVKSIADAIRTQK